MDKAIILFGHGSRDPLWRLPMDAVAQRIRSQHPGMPVRCAFLELEQPGLADAAADLAAQGALQVTVVPMFLGTGRHAREDLPGLVEEVRSTHPGVDFRLQQAVGEDPRVLDLLARIAVT
ncbi:sirohydrochlorin chelatase [Caenimonas terrae]|uniref:Sirohydrochlorin chelatase n=1 Tax=Caenimonas terrae TaxID=696074 RepID=A0ABW0NIU2_9BURK